MDARKAALTQGWPILLSAAVVGATFGIVARQAGHGLLEIMGLSTIVYAGAAQFAIVELLRTGAGAPAAIVAAILINMRHLLMGAALRERFAGEPLHRRLGLAYILTDEAFAMGIAWYRRGGTGIAYYAWFGSLMWVCWNVGTVAGAIAGEQVGDPARFGIDFAIAASFIAIVALAIRHRSDVLVAGTSALAAGALALAGAPLVAIVAAAAFAPLVALSRRQ